MTERPRLSRLRSIAETRCARGVAFLSGFPLYWWLRDSPARLVGLLVVLFAVAIYLDALSE